MIVQTVRHLPNNCWVLQIQPSCPPWQRSKAPKDDRRAEEGCLGWPW